MITNAHIVTEGGQTSKAQATKIHLSTLTESDFVFIDESVNDASFINLYSVKTGLEALIRRIYYFTNNKVRLIKHNDIIMVVLVYVASSPPLAANNVSHHRLSPLYLLSIETNNRYNRTVSFSSLLRLVSQHIIHVWREGLCYDLPQT
jgi:hypothetical protein